jgi:NitT/TauT family transport system ATP-binding protein
MTLKARSAVGLKSVAISFGHIKNSPYEAVAPTNLDIGEHEFLAIVGPTGCGKSTLLNAVAGLLAPASGSVEIFGKPLKGLNREAGYLFQQDTLMPWKTVLENVSIGLEVAGAASRDARRTAFEWLERVGLGAFTDRFPATLSGGQRKRTGLAQVLIRNPKILLMDEPFGPLDAQTRQIMGDLLLTLWSEDRKAVLFVTHDLDEAISLADRVLIMSAGPRSRIIGDFRVPLARPRDIADIRHDATFNELHREIWEALRDEVMTAYRQTSGAGR